MSNSIWKMPDQKPDTDQHVLFFAGGGMFPYLGFYYPKFDLFEDWESKDVQRWASVFDVIAQAEKAERLEKENEAMRYEFEVWHGNYECEVEEKKQLQKAVDLAQECLLSISDGYDIMKADAETIKRLFYAIQDEAGETYKGIKQLIKGTTND